MTDVLVFAERRDGAFRKVAFEAVSAAARMAGGLGGQVIAVAVGPGAADQGGELGRYGAARVIALESSDLSTYSAEALAAAMAGIAREVQPGYVLATASAEGRDWLPRLAALLDAPLVADVTDLALADGRLEATRPLLAGKAIARMVAHGEPVVLSLRPKVFSPEELGSGPAPVESREPTAAAVRAVVKELLATGGGTIDVTEADIIVAGGRGVGGADGFKAIQDLASQLEAAVGASRAAVDAGWIDHAHQVGQTGKVVNPTLYIACGISGAVQHLAGMGNSQVIVAINKDPEAPIFKIADYGIVGNLFEVIPVLKAELAKAI